MDRPIAQSGDARRVDRIRPRSQCRSRKAGREREKACLEGVLARSKLGPRTSAVAGSAKARIAAATGLSDCNRDSPEGKPMTRVVKSCTPPKGLRILAQLIRTCQADIRAE